MNASFRKTILPFSRCVAFALVLIGQSLFGQSLLVLDDLGGTFSQGNRINNAGQVVGSSSIAGDGLEHAFINTAGVTTDLGTLGGPYSTAQGINDSGQIVGFSVLAPDFEGNSEAHAFISTGGVMTDLGTLAGSFSWGSDINNSGQVTGYSMNPSSSFRAYITSGGAMTELGTLGGPDSFGYGINNLGQVTGSSSLASNGFHAFISTGGVMTDLGALPGVGIDNSQGRAINDAGQVAGFSYINPGAYHAFLYSDGVMTDIGVLGDDFSSAAFGINSSGQAVGYSLREYGDDFTYFNADLYAFIYSGGVMIDLNTMYSSLLSDGTSAGFLQLNIAAGINDHGQITGAGEYFDGTSKEIRAFLLDTNSKSSVPDSSRTFGLLSLSLCSLVLVRRRFANHA